MSVTSIEHAMFTVFVYLTVMHPVADFMLPRKKWGAWHCVISMNPFHAIIDMAAPHRKYISDYRWSFQHSKTFVDEPFWPLLGMDQFLHVMSNLIWAYIIAVIIVVIL